MNVIFLYGHHREELDFGYRICAEFSSRHPESSSIVNTRRIKNSVPAGSSIELENIVYEEIIGVLEECKPGILVDIHHTGGWDPSHGMMRTPIQPYYSNCELDPEFGEYLKYMKEGVVPILVPHRNNLNLKSPDEVEVANQMGTRYVSVEIYRHGKNWVFPDDDLNRQVFDRSVKFLHRIYRYSKMSNS